MQFEVNKDNPNLGEITLNPLERNMVTNSLLQALFRAATGRDRIDNDSYLFSLCKILLKPENLQIKNIAGLSSEHLKAMSLEIEKTYKEVDYEQAKQVGGFVAELNVASRILNQGHIISVDRMQEDIDEIIRHTDIPDSPEGIA